MSELSKCCGEEIDFDSKCVKCGRCQLCDGTGEVSCDEQDSDGNWQRGVGMQKCECQNFETDEYTGDED